MLAKPESGWNSHRTDRAVTQNVPVEVSELGTVLGGQIVCPVWGFQHLFSLFIWEPQFWPLHMVSGPDASPSNGCSDNYMDFKLFTTLCPQSNFRINLRVDKELVAVLQAWSDMLGLLSTCYNSSGRPWAPGEQGAAPSAAQERKKSINLSI